MFDYDDDDEDDFEGYYVDGHWDWNYAREELEFLSDVTSITEEATASTTMLIAPVEFKELGLLEQNRLRKFMKNQNENDVVTLQDVKDVVLFTAPRAILTPSLINMLHIATIDRFLRALILYCQYFLQISKTMNERHLQTVEKIRTPNSVVIELEYRNNLQDLRLLVAKEYCNLISGAGEYRKFHHKGHLKLMHSLSIKEAILFESLVRISIQIVWVSLARQSLSEIDVEVQRIFKSDLFNVAKHRSTTNTKMSPEEMFVLQEGCLKHDPKMLTQSPLRNEIGCHRDVDYHIYALGIVHYPKLSTRLHFLEGVLTLEESEFDDHYNMTLGIIGLKRSRFDTILNVIVTPTTVSSRSASRSRQMSKSLKTVRSCRSRKSTMCTPLMKKPFPDIVLPETDEYEDFIGDSFETASYHLQHKQYVEVQKNKWLARVTGRKPRAFVKRSRH